MENDPYAPPSLSNDPASSQSSKTHPSATLNQRLAAFFIDLFIITLLFLAFYFSVSYTPIHQLFDSDDSVSEVITTLIGFFIFLVLNFHLIHTRDQTIGKLLLKIKVTDLQGNSPSTANQLGIRYGIFYLISVIPTAGDFLTLIDVLFIFGKNHRCLHDLVAGTKVVQC